MKRLQKMNHMITGSIHQPNLAVQHSQGRDNMLNNIFRSVLIMLLSVTLMVGCTSRRANKFTCDERSSLVNVIFIPGAEKVSSHTEYLKIEESAIGKRVKLLGSGNENWMSESTYRNRTSAAMKAVEDCLAITYGNKRYSPDRFRSFLSKLPTESRPFHIQFLTDAEQEQFWNISKEERAIFIKNHNADAALIISAYHLAGLAHKSGLRSGIVSIGYTGLYAQISDFQADEDMYFSGYSFTDKVPVDSEGFCPNFIASFEQAVDDHWLRVYNSITGTK